MSATAASPALAPSAADELDLFVLEAGATVVQEATEAFLCLLGRPAGEVNGRSLGDLAFVDDRGTLDGWAKGLLGDGAATCECRLAQSNGQALYTRLIGHAQPSDGTWRVASTDVADLSKLVADRRDLKTRFDLAIGQTTVAMWDLEIERGRFNWEPRAAKVLGVETDHLPCDPAAMLDLVRAEDRSAVSTAFDQLGTRGHAEVSLRVGADHTLRHLSLRGRVLDRSDSSESVRAVGILLDITTEKALEEQLLRMSVSDGLTGVPNRRGFDQSLRSEWRRCTRDGHPITVLMIDVDRFKSLNDAYGHIVGDQVLVSIARGLGGALNREGDVLARYGGEEFAAVVPGAAVDAARVIAQRLADTVRAITPRQTPGWRPTVSVGAATWVPAAGSRKPQELLRDADRALYAAKDAGRDRVLHHVDLR